MHFIVEFHLMPILQAVVLYVVTIFSIKHFMKDREPLKLQLPVLIWNFSIAILSGLCAAVMTEEYFESTFNKGFNGASPLCSTRKEFFSGKNGFAVLRKQPLHFFHWYHHAFTLYISWFGYSGASPSSRHAIYFNAVVHTLLYSYFFLTTINIRPPKFIGRWIMMAEIIHFFFILYALIHLTYLAHVLKEPCQIEPYRLVITCKKQSKKVKKID
ncbi:hypothetical protein PRIPAC_82554 [Pristionchus pacificus]|nr:hypothetical protein PRIPAC_82554 [Pristionchus pacificus]